MGCISYIWSINRAELMIHSSRKWLSLPLILAICFLSNIFGSLRMLPGFLHLRDFLQGDDLLKGLLVRDLAQSRHSQNTGYENK